MSASRVSACRRSAAMSSRLRASSFATSHGHRAARAIPRCVRRCAGRRQRPHCLGLHEPLEIPGGDLELGRRGGLREICQGQQCAKCQECAAVHARDYRMRRIALLLPAVPGVARAADRATAARVDGECKTLAIRRLSACWRGCRRRDEGLAIARDRDAQKVFVRTAGRRAAQGRLAARPRCRRCRRCAAGSTSPRRSAVASKAIMASVRCTRIICWR